MAPYPARAAAQQASRLDRGQPALRRVEPVLRARSRAVDDLHLRACTRPSPAPSTRRRRPSTPWSSTSSGCRRGDTLLDVGCGWGSMVRYAARRGVRVIGATLSRQQAEWAQKAIVNEGLHHLAEVRHLDYRDVPESDFDAISSIGLTEHIGVRQYPAYFASLRDKLRPGGRLLNHCITRPNNKMSEAARRRSSTGTSSRTASCGGPGRIIKEIQDAGFDVRHEENIREHYAADAARLVREPARALGRVRRRGRRGHQPRVGAVHGGLPAGLRAQRGPAAPGARREARSQGRRAGPAAAVVARLSRLRCSGRRHDSRCEPAR